MEKNESLKDKITLKLKFNHHVLNPQAPRSQIVAVKLKDKRALSELGTEARPRVEGINTVCSNQFCISVMHNDFFFLLGEMFL